MRRLRGTETTTLSQRAAALPHEKHQAQDLFHLDAVCDCRIYAPQRCFPAMIFRQSYCGKDAPQCIAVVAAALGLG
jgi:hypothetical protein